MQAVDVRGKLGDLWCAVSHDSAMWPIHGEYQCRTCGRRYPVPWSEDRILAARPAPAQLSRSASVRIAVLLAIVAVGTLRAGDVRKTQPAAGPGLAFARYLDGVDTQNTWTSETVEINASLPKLRKHGRLLAIRKRLGLSAPQYQVLEFAGDPTVRQQVIVRYLTGERRAAAVPASSVAITPANYKFRYKGVVKNGSSEADVFEIAARAKREGLIKGELWIDSETGAPVRMSGYLVKKPSIFVKRVEVTREMSAALHVTHFSIDTRLVGRAELTIAETPAAESVEER
jgi:hypothetical protein